MNQEEQWLLTEKYKGIESDAFHAELERLAEGEPLAYLIGSIPFLNCTIHLDSHPLIPRPETEFWVEKAIVEIERVAPVAPHVLDLCAGSGAIGVAIAKAIPNALVDFAEIDQCHLPTIKKNLKFNEIDSAHCRILQSNLFEKINHTYDFILTNPPYIDPAVDRAETSVKDHEPHLALYGGKNGLELIADIIADARKYLSKKGQLWIEHEPEQVAAVHTLGKQYGFISTTHNDQYNTPRYSTLTVAQ